MSEVVISHCIYDAGNDMLCTYLKLLGREDLVSASTILNSIVYIS